jgi:hypothetical protein
VLVLLLPGELKSEDSAGTSFIWVTEGADAALRLLLLPTVAPEGLAEGGVSRPRGDLADDNELAEAAALWRAGESVDAGAGDGIGVGAAAGAGRCRGMRRRERRAAAVGIGGLELRSSPAKPGFASSSGMPNGAGPTDASLNSARATVALRAAAEVGLRFGACLRSGGGLARVPLGAMCFGVK